MLFSSLLLLLLGAVQTTCASDVSSPLHKRAAIAAAPPPPPAPRPAPPAPAPKPPSPPSNPSRHNPPKPKPDDKPDAPDAPDGPDDSIFTKTSRVAGSQASASAVRPNSVFRTTSTARPYIQTSDPSPTTRRSATSTILNSRPAITLGGTGAREQVDVQLIVSNERKQS
jgi:hypothetical protein